MLIKCPECEKEVSDKAYSCPNCGFPIQKFLSEVEKPPEEQKPKKRQVRRKKLPNGFGRITELKGKNLRKPFRAMVSDGKDEHGRPIGRLLKPEAYFETYNEAYKALMNYNENPYNFAEDITMEELHEKWSSWYYEKISSGRKTALEAAWKYCEPIYLIKVQMIRRRDIKNLIDNGSIMKNGKVKQPSAYTKINMKTVISSMLDYAVEYEIIDTNPVKSMAKDQDYIPTANRPHIAFTDDEMASILKEVNKNQFADMAYVQCYMGWRPGELLDIKVNALNMLEWTITGGSKTKSGIDRIVPVHEKIRPIIQRYYSASITVGCEYLFPHNGKHMSYGIYRHGFDDIVKRNGMNPDHRPHDCRKQFITMAKKSGVDEYAIKRIVGHLIRDITESVYTVRGVEWLHSEISKIP